MIVRKVVETKDLEKVARLKQLLSNWKQHRMTWPFQSDVTIFVRDADAQIVNDAYELLDHLLSPTSQADTDEFGKE